MSLRTTLAFLSCATILASCAAGVKTNRRELPSTVPSEQPETVAEEPPSKPVTRDQRSDLVKAIESNNSRNIKQAALAVLESNPKHIEAMNALAMAHFQEGNPSLAKMMLQRALQVEKRSGLYNNLGLIYLKEGEDKEAIDSFREAIKLDSKNDKAAANAGAIYVQNKDYNKAITVLKIAYDNGNREISTLHNYAVALAATGDAPRAESFYEKVLAAGPNNTEALTNYSIYLIDHKKDYKKGIEIINKLRFIGVPSQARDKIRMLEEKANAEMNKG